ESDPLGLRLHGVHVAEYPPAGPHRQHEAVRTRVLLAHKKEIRELAKAQDGEHATLVPLKIYFKDGRAKLLVGVAEGRKKADKRQDIAKKEAKRDIERELRRRR
ncbi:MAG: SsrA-binding protein, partial [Planctomycetota bacterium]|nr:SsrA-binding protein [Planctomycetota bacterium]